MAAVAEDPNALFWKAYAAAIMERAGKINIGDTNAFYLATSAQRGPPGGDGISQKYTNEGIFQLGDNLLPADQLFYSPSSENSYIQSLQDYLRWVDIGGDPTPENVARVNAASEDLDAAHKKFKTELTKALSDFKDEQAAGMTSKLTFAQWAISNAGAYEAAKTAYDTATAAYTEAYSRAYGPLGQQKLQDQNKLNQAEVTDSASALPGFTMECAIGTPPSPREIQDHQGDDSISNPASVPRPAYEALNYVSVIQQALMRREDDPPRANLEFTFRNGQDVRVEEFNHSFISGGVTVDYEPWISFGVSASQDNVWHGISTNVDFEQITFKLTFDDMAFVGINPSASWDLGDVRARYKGLLPGAPKSVHTLVKPSQLLLATHLGYTIKLGAAMANEFDSHYQQVTQAQGSIRILGILAGPTANFSQKNYQNTHMLDWNASSQEITVKPTTNTGFATIVGIVGEKLNVSA
ncbi:hypothetical protein F4861DRAFT_241146 [Xylaria intraflava]|nr:hypothetical protein F4861DRAFT_241146 [Xylaria intraflava]